MLPLADRRNVCNVYNRCVIVWIIVTRRSREYFTYAIHTRYETLFSFRVTLRREKTSWIHKSLVFLLQRLGNTINI